MIIDPMTWEQREAIHRLKRLLAKLGIKSARPVSRPVLTGQGAILKISGIPVTFVEGVQYDVHNVRDLTIDGSNN